jgi:hypothetical protein
MTQNGPLELVSTWVELSMRKVDGSHQSGKRFRPIAVFTTAQEVAMLSVLIGVLIICVVGAICFWAIDKFVNESRLASLLKLLVVLICLAAILQRVLPLLGINWL